MKTPAGPNFIEMGITQLLSVPYAKYADTAGNPLSAGAGININNNIITNTGDLSNTNELQSLTINGDKLSISDGNVVTLPTGTTYTEGAGIDIIGNTISANDPSPTNEIQTLSVNGNQLNISGGNSVSLPTSNYNAGSGIQITNNTITALDASPTNEIQTLSLNGQQLSLSNGGGSVQLPGGGSSSWTVNNTDIINNPVSSHVLVGTNNSSTAKLYVVSTGAEEAGHFVSPGAGNALNAYNNGTGAGISASSLNGRGGQFTSSGGAAGYFSSTGGPALIAETGNVGIGVLDPVRKLHVNGSTLLTNTAANGVALEIGAGNVGVGITSPTHKFEVNGSSFFENNSGPSLVVGNGNVGIGTAVPIYKLHVKATTGNGIMCETENGTGINVSALSSNVAGYFHAINSSAGVFYSQSHYSMVAEQGTVGTSSNHHGIGLNYDSDFWSVYIDNQHDYNFSYNDVLRAWIFDTDGSFHNNSDRSLKKDIQPFDNVLSRLTKLQAYTYHMKNAPEDSPVSVGFMAQEVEDVFPQLVVEKEGYKSLCYDHFAVLSVQAIKEQQAEIEDLKKEIADMKQMMMAMKTEPDKR